MMGPEVPAVKPDLPIALAMVHPGLQTPIISLLSSRTNFTQVHPARSYRVPQRVGQQAGARHFPATVEKENGTFMGHLGQGAKQNTNRTNRTWSA